MYYGLYLLRFSVIIFLINDERNMCYDFRNGIHENSKVSLSIVMKALDIEIGNCDLLIRERAI